ncbi:maturase [Paracidovorax avenae]|uniref:reverse transcriptase domain-containing protein n=1 Tax=Paracidovorax avenae TaxID=80867 RepID=UPI000D16153F|nr:reverse transcriptase domain-containing protein [Paracidovorax avenae]AVS90284.1 maturase [Paracidovorax avenae]
MKTEKSHLHEKILKQFGDDILFDLIFSSSSLLDVFNENFAKSSSKGIDRLNGFQFSIRAPFEFFTASAKIKAGTFRFSPFLEVLRPKSRDKPPRLIGIPTIRDRVVLHQLNKFLAALYPERVPKNVASTYVRELSNDLRDKSSSTTWICSTDIKTFYDSINQSRAISVLEKRIKSKSALKLIRHAITTPTVPQNTSKSRHKEYKSEGIPQGLAISNILASIYMQDVDEAMTKLGVIYYRYVDDVLMYGDEETIFRAYKSLRARLRHRNLSLHKLGSGKTHIAPLSQKFSYLGYSFHMPTVSVRPSTTERFLQSIAAKFSDFTHNKNKRLERHKYLTEDRLKEIFLLELNERITGAISSKKRYGWIAYFNQITDLTLLHQIDFAINGMFKRLKEFKKEPPVQLKKLHRAYFEMKFNPQGGYVRNYDQITKPIEMLELLVSRGRIDPAIPLTDNEIQEKYEKYLKQILATMHSDEGSVYS